MSPPSVGRIIVCIAPEAVAYISATGEIDADVPEDDALRQVLGDLQGVLAGLQAQLKPLFGDAQQRLRDQAADVGPPDLSLFYRLDDGSGDPLGLVRSFVELEAEREGEKEREREAERAVFDLLAELRRNALIDAAYYKPPALGAEVPSVTPNLGSYQGYLGAAPGGIDAHWAWSYPGGHGQDVRIADVEEDWLFTHEDLLLNTGGAVASSPGATPPERNHGTAVAGMLGGDVNPYGIIGICPAATFHGVSVSGAPGGTAVAIWRAAEGLRAGDILLIEVHVGGPTSEFNNVWEVKPGSQDGYLAVEYYPDDFAAIRYATDRGIVVVAAAGNGGIALESARPVQEMAQPLLALHDWPDPFLRDAGGDSGSILVGAGAAPGGGDPDRARLQYSNCGACVDVQGWGERVATTGGQRDPHDSANVIGGELQGGQDENRWYTSSFSGTSSAAAMVAGALACVQGILRAAGRAPLSPHQARALVREPGSAQVTGQHGDPLTERIGPRPNLAELVPRAIEAPPDPGQSFSAPGWCGGPMPAVVVIAGGGCWPLGGGGAGPHWGGPHWGGPHWGGPHWGGPHWGGPHWGGPHWGGPHWGGPSSAGDWPPAAPVPPSSVLRRPGFAPRRLLESRRTR